MKVLTEEKGTHTILTIELEDGEVLSPKILNTMDLPKVGSGPDQITAHKGVILDGKMPLWLASFLVHEYHPVAWVGLNSPRDGGAIVVARHTVNSPGLGEVVPL